jgi:hypothetical protein
VNAEGPRTPEGGRGFRYPFTSTWVQFSSSAEVGRRGTPAWRSLKTEQRRRRLGRRHVPR